MKEMRTVDAVGHMLCHDITQIIPGVTKDAVFRKGHIITEEDVPVLLSVGKQHVYIWEVNEDMVHENDAAEVLRQLCQGPHMRATEPKEGKIELFAEEDGLFEVDVERLKGVNSLFDSMVATRPGGFTVHKGDKLAGMRVIPLIIHKDRLEAAKAAAGDTPLLKLTPFRPRTFGVVTTGSEVYNGLIKDKFTPVLEAKMAEFGCKMVAHEYCDDKADMITAAVNKMAADGVEMILCSGGMSVDPDDRTPLGIRQTGADIVTYGAPVLPGAMFLLSYLPDGRPVCGLPGCVMYAKRTIFDLVLPYLMADVPVTREHLAALGHGGLCLNCDVCHFPNCCFGKGV